MKRVPGGVSKFATDYMFMADGGTPITILAGWDGLTLPTWYLAKARVMVTQKEHSPTTCCTQVTRK